MIKGGNRRGRNEKGGKVNHFEREAVMQEQKKQLIHSLYQIGVVQFGEFTLKTGQVVPVYFDLRRIVSYPAVLKNVSEMLWHSIQHCQFDFICGVPYTALPMATSLSVAHELPMVMRRKEHKQYGTKQKIEGVYQPGQTCLIVEDVITTGDSILETKQDLELAGLHCKETVMVIDRQQGGRKQLEKNHLIVHAALTLTDILYELVGSNRLSIYEQEIVKKMIAMTTE